LMWLIGRRDMTNRTDRARQKMTLLHIVRVQCGVLTPCRIDEERHESKQYHYEPHVRITSDG